MDVHEKKIFDPKTFVDEESTIDVKKNYPYRGLGITLSTLDEFLDALPEPFKNIEVSARNDFINLLKSFRLKTKTIWQQSCCGKLWRNVRAKQ